VVAGVDLGDQCPACLLGQQTRILTADAAAKRGGDLVFRRALHRRGVAADLVAGPGVIFAERLPECVAAPASAEGSQYPAVVWQSSYCPSK
jgi:hypothetical protein